MYRFALNVGVGAVDEELLGNAIGFKDDVLNEDVFVGDLELFPGLSFVPREFDELCGHTLFSNNDDGTMVANIVDVSTLFDDVPLQATVSRKEESLLLVVFSKVGAHVASAEYDTDSRLCGVDGGKLSEV